MQIHLEGRKLVLLLLIIISLFILEAGYQMIDNALKAARKNKRPPNISDIAHALSISERTVRRYCKGEHFVQRNAATG